MEENNFTEEGRTMKSFYQKERECEYLFESGGPFWHLCTDGNLSGIIFKNEEQLRFGITDMAMCAAEYKVRVITDVIMNSHIHSIVEGEKEECLGLFGKYKTRLKRYFSSATIASSDISASYDLSNFNCSLLPIDSLSTLRNEIAYVNRNGYLVNNNYTPFSYPWGSGFLYFNQFAQSIHGESFNLLTYREIRKICHCRTISLPDNYMVANDMILPASYCDYKRGEKFYRDAHQYFYMISKDTEAYGLVAKRLSDTVFLTDEEMYSAVCKASAKIFNTKHPQALSPKEKIEIAKVMHSEYNASNGQIRRILKLEQALVNELFPLKSK